MESVAEIRGTTIFSEQEFADHPELSTREKPVRSIDDLRRTERCRDLRTRRHESTTA
jgi:hypothetical protein